MKEARATVKGAKDKLEPKKKKCWNCKAVVAEAQVAYNFAVDTMNGLPKTHTELAGHGHTVSPTHP